MRDIILQIDSYSEPTSAETIDQAVQFAAVLGCPLTGMATHIDIRTPDNWLAERLLNVSKLAEAEEAKSLEAARTSLVYLEKIAQRAGVKQEGVIVRANLHAVGSCIARQARTRDLCLVSVGAQIDSQRAVAEEVIFESGRPVLVFHPERAPLPSGQLKTVAIAWDGSRWAARAVAGAIPILQKSQDVRIVTAVGEKAAAAPNIGLDLVRHLSAHGITARIDEIDGVGRSIGASLDTYVEAQSPQIIVMGAYGSSRLKEFILGGATAHILNSGRVAAFLAH